MLKDGCTNREQSEILLLLAVIPEQVRKSQEKPLARRIDQRCVVCNLSCASIFYNPVFGLTCTKNN